MSKFFKKKKEQNADAELLNLENTQEIELKEQVIKEDIGDVLELVADEDNPIGDGKEYKEDE